MTVQVEGRAGDHLVVANFRVEFDKGLPDSEFVRSVTGMTSETRYAERRQGGSRDPKFDAIDNMPSQVTITFTQPSLNNAFVRWYNAVQDGTSAALRKRTINVIPLAPDGTEAAYMVVLESCSPVSITSGDFDATSQDGLVGTLVVQPEKIRFGVANPVG